MNIKDLILDNLDISVSKFCRQIDISRQTIDNILNERNIPSMLTIKKICKYFNADYKDFL